MAVDFFYTFAAGFVILELFQCCCNWCFSPDSWKLLGVLTSQRLGCWSPKSLPLPPGLPSFVSLCDLHSGLLLAAPAFMCLPSFVSLHDLHSGLLLAAPAFICPLPSFVSLHLSPCMISILACSWLLLPSFVALHLSPFVISILACSWPLLPSFVALHSPDSWKL